jgi:hypothetical protein
MSLLLIISCDNDNVRPYYIQASSPPVTTKTPPTIVKLIPIFNGDTTDSQNLVDGFSKNIRGIKTIKPFKKY